MIANKQINITVDEHTAYLYDKAPAYKKHSINFLLSEWLKEDTNKEAISVLMDNIGFQAMSNGLNPEKLEELLNEQE